MLHSLKIKNFSSFREEQELSLLGTKSTQGDRRFMTTPSDKNVARVAMIYGANASGKSNLLRALGFVSWFILNSWDELKTAEEISFDPFLFTDNAEEPTSFEIVSEDKNGIVYTYNLTLTTKEIVYESLRMREKEDKRRHLVFIRNKEEYKIFSRAKFSMRDIPQKSLRSNASFVSAIRQTTIDSFDGFISTILNLANIDSNVSFLFKDLQKVLKILQSNEKAKQFVEKQISNFDMGISGLEIMEKDISDALGKEFLKALHGTESQKVTLYEADILHRINNKEHRLQISKESNGTQKVIIFLTDIFLILTHGGVLLYDEIESALHPLLVESLLEFFYDEDINSRGAQLICTSHCPDSMNSLHKQQIFFTEKNEQLESSVFRLSDVAGVRNDDNIMQKYLSGTYGGVPNL